MRIPADTLSAEVFRARRDRLGAVLEKKKWDAYFFSGVADLYYLTGFHSEGFYGLVSGKKTWLFASALLAGQVRENAPGCRLIVGKRLSLALEDLAKEHRFKRIGFDPDQLVFVWATRSEKRASGLPRTPWRNYGSSKTRRNWPVSGKPVRSRPRRWSTSNPDCG
ncbi:MAG: aminopeptidase P family N-terminal domain-containing protein [Elusimicrobia bacterium]|nr:aminopeptidase P family N-terminal domain-containing protein [Elusimicrobiota bacterium]